MYNDEFFESLDGVTNALDNIKARESRLGAITHCIRTEMVMARSVHGPTLRVLPKAVA